MFTRILVPTDFSEPSDAALEYARGFSLAFGASLHVLHVIEAPCTTGSPEAEAMSTLRSIERRAPSAELCPPPIIDYAIDLVFGLAGSIGWSAVAFLWGRNRVARLMQDTRATVRTMSAVALRTLALADARILGRDPLLKWVLGPAAWACTGVAGAHSAHPTSAHRERLRHRSVLSTDDGRLPDDGAGNRRDGDWILAVG
jgi:Universal stress protein family